MSPAIVANLSNPDDADDVKDFQSRDQDLISSIATAHASVMEPSPISSLPYELLERIFGACIRWSYGYRKPESCLAWTQVCTHWRRVALDSARLWRYIDISHSRFAREFLCRSKSAPIFIVSHSPEKRFSDSFRPHAERVHSINVLMRSSDIQEFLSSIGPSLPNLSTLSLALPPGSPNLRCDIRMPPVRHLALDGIAVPWDTCSKLTHLSLRGLGEAFSPSPLQLCAILDRSPQLSSLRMENIGIRFTPSDKVSNHTVTLLQLKELVLFSQAPQFVHYMLTQLHIPPPAKLLLTCPSYNQLSALGPILNGYDKFLDSDISVSALRLRRWSMQLLRRTSSPWSEQGSDISLSITFLSPLQTPQLRDFRHLFDISRLTVLELDAVVLDDIPINAMNSLFSAMPHLNTLRVALNELRVLLSILGSSTATALDEVLCPNLSLLSFSRSGDVWWGFAEQWLMELLTCIRNRAPRTRLRTLEFILCHGINALVVQPFETLVENIVVLERTGE